MVEYTGLGKKSNKDSGEINPLGVHRVSLKLIVKVIDSTFVYHFVDPDLRVEIIFTKQRKAENGGIDFEIVDRDNSTHW